MTGFDWSLDPLKHLDDIYQEALTQNLPEPNAMTLATVNSRGQPAARVVLFKGFLRNGLTFYSNYEGRKAREIQLNPQVCVNFFWPQLAKQVRIEGRAEKLTRLESEAYFKTRSRISQIGAWASAQSEEIADAEYLEKKWSEFDKRFAGQEVSCPPHWGGYLIVPSEVEIWLGRHGRLHERYVFQKMGADWKHLMRSP